MAPVVALPTLRSHPRWSPRWGLHGACSLRARSCGPSRTLSPLPPHLAALSLGGGGGLSAPPYIHHPPLGGRRCVWGGGAPLSSSLRSTHIAGTTQARRRHEARHLSLCRGGGLPCGSRRRPSYPASAPPFVPPFKLARRVLPTGTVVWPVPRPLSAASPPCCFVPGGGGAFRPPLPSSPPLGGRRCVWGGGRPCHLPFVARMSQARRKHGAGTRRGTCPCAGGGGLPSGSCRRPSYPAFAPPVVTLLGLAAACSLRARSCGPSRTLSPPPPHPAALFSRGWGGFPPPPTFIPYSGGGGGVWGGGGRPCRLPFVARMSQARRKHDASTR